MMMRTWSLVRIVDGGSIWDVMISRIYEKGGGSGIGKRSISG